MIKRIVVFGCSYCTGEEILYHELGTELDHLHKSTSNDPRLFFDKIEKNSLTEKLKTIQQKQMNLAWPKKLSVLLGIECLNLSESGNSMQKMLWQFLDQRHRGNIRETDLILFGQTKTERGLYFRESPISFQVATVNGPELNKILGISECGGISNVINESLDEAIMSWFNDDRLLWDFLMVSQCLEYWKSKFNLFVVPAMSLNNLVLRDYNKDLFKSLLQDSTRSDLYLTKKGLDCFIENDTDYLPWGHPKEIVHDRYAQYLKEVIYDRFQI